MSAPYEENLDGDSVLRLPPGARHEVICHRLHAMVAASVANFAGAKLLPARTRIQLSQRSALCPDLAVVAVATGKIWLAAEVVNSSDHHPDTVIKKQIYETAKLPRLWVVDPRYDNVEVYHTNHYGLILQNILAGSECLTEKLLPEFEVAIVDLFRAAATQPTS